MRIIDILTFGLTREKVVETKSNYTNPEARSNAGLYIPLHSQVLDFDGERNPGSIGPATHYIPNYYALSTRSWQSYMDSPVSVIVINKWVNWIVGSGLKPKASPSKITLKTEGIDLEKSQTERFNDESESRWDIWSNSKRSSISGEKNFNELCADVFLNAKLSGDCLVILHYIDECVKIQVVDGARVRNPRLSETKGDGWFYSNGVKISSITGSVLGYYVYRNNSTDGDEILAYSSTTGLRSAFLVKGSKWRIDYHRGLPVVASVLETMTKLERYRDATLESAEEVAKIAFQVVHQNFSDGSTPFQQQMAEAFDNHLNGALPEDEVGNKFANRVAVTTGKQAVNNPKGAKIETLGGGSTVQGFNEFHEPNANLICAAVGIPPNIAFSLYTNSYSASRAATKDWDHTMDVERDLLRDQFLAYVWKFWLYTEAAKGKISAPGYAASLVTKNYMISESYERVRFTGPHFPHIDPVKEVKAEREKLGPLGANIPLTTIEQATESLGTGDSDSNIEQFADEIEIFKDLVPQEEESKETSLGE
jgi:capsid protein